MKINRRKIELELFLKDKELQDRFHIEAYWMPVLPKVDGSEERYKILSASQATWEGEESGHLIIASPLMRDAQGEMLLFSFLIEELYGINYLTSPETDDAIQIQSVQNGTIARGYRELTVSENGRASTKVGYFKSTTNSYHL